MPPCFPVSFCFPVSVSNESNFKDANVHAMTISSRFHYISRLFLSISFGLFHGIVFKDLGFLKPCFEFSSASLASLKGAILLFGRKSFHGHFQRHFLSIGTGFDVYWATTNGNEKRFRGIFFKSYDSLKEKTIFLFPVWNIGGLENIISIK